MPSLVKKLLKNKSTSAIQKTIVKTAMVNSKYTITYTQGLVKGEKLCFRNLYFYFWHGESTSTASQITSPASQKIKDLYKVQLLL